MINLCTRLEIMCCLRGLHNNKLIYFYTHILFVYMYKHSLSFAIHFSLNIQNTDFKISQTARLNAFTIKKMYKKLKCHYISDL